MRVITEPKVTVISVPQFFEHPDYDIPEDGTDVERLGAFAAKSCYQSWGKEGRANVANQRAVIESLHGSVLEHAHISFYVEGVTRALSLEMNRHRHLNISQQSTRYVKEDEGAIVLDPYYAKLYRKYKMTFDQFGPHHGVMMGDIGDYDVREVQLLHGHLNTAEAAFRRYAAEVNTLMHLNPLKLDGFALRKWARGKARNILPHALETKAVYTTNFRSLRHILEVRSSRHAEPEIRRLMKHIWDAVVNIAPTYFEDFTYDMVDDLPEFRPTYSKV